MTVASTNVAPHFFIALVPMVLSQRRELFLNLTLKPRSFSTAEGRGVTATCSAGGKELRAVLFYTLSLCHEMSIQCARIDNSQVDMDPICRQRNFTSHGSLTPPDRSFLAVTAPEYTRTRSVACWECSASLVPLGTNETKAERLIATTALEGTPMEEEPGETTTKILEKDEHLSDSMERTDQTGILVIIPSTLGLLALVALLIFLAVRSRHKVFNADSRKTGLFDSKRKINKSPIGRQGICNEAEDSEAQSDPQRRYSSPAWSIRRSRDDMTLLNHSHRKIVLNYSISLDDLRLAHRRLNQSSSSGFIAIKPSFCKAISLVRRPVGRERPTKENTANTSRNDTAPHENECVEICATREMLIDDTAYANKGYFSTSEEEAIMRATNQEMINTASRGKVQTLGQQQLGRRTYLTVSETNKDWRKIYSDEQLQRPGQKNVNHSQLMTTFQKPGRRDVTNAACNADFQVIEQQEKVGVCEVKVKESCLKIDKQNECKNPQ